MASPSVREATPQKTLRAPGKRVRNVRCKHVVVVGNSHRRGPEVATCACTAGVEGIITVLRAL
jgi:hypothetical protein